MMFLFMSLLLLCQTVGTAQGVPIRVPITRNEYLGTSDSSLLMLALLYVLRRRRRGQTQHSRRYWVCPVNRLRLEQGAWDNLVCELRSQEPEKFQNYHRLTLEQFDDLLEQIAPLIQQSQVVREPIPAGLALSLTLRYLASGESMVSLSYAYRIGRSTTSRIIRQTCLAIWETLQPQVLTHPTEEQWKEIAEDFERLWNFPNCVGAIDGKHIVVQCFNKAGSEFFNYKGSHSTSLMAVVDARYKFIFVSIGSKGRESDGGIFKRSDFGQAIATERLPLPQSKLMDGFPIPLPPVFLGDQAFPLLPQLMRPYPSTNNQQPAHRIFNYRHCRARRVVENAFGVLANRFRVFRKPIIASLATVDAITQATVVLHNWLLTQVMHARCTAYIPNAMLDQEARDGSVIEGTWRQEAPPTGLIPVDATHIRNPSTRAKNIRDNIGTYFMSAGQVPWQWRHLPAFQLHQ